MQPRTREITKTESLHLLSRPKKRQGKKSLNHFDVSMICIRTSADGRHLTFLFFLNAKGEFKHRESPRLARTEGGTEAKSAAKERRSVLSWVDVVPVSQGCGFNLQTGHVRKRPMNAERKWSNKSLFFLSLSKIYR